MILYEEEWSFCREMWLIPANAIAQVPFKAVPFKFAPCVREQVYNSDICNQVVKCVDYDHVKVSQNTIRKWISGFGLLRVWKILKSGQYMQIFKIRRQKFNLTKQLKPRLCLVSFTLTAWGNALLCTTYWIQSHMGSKLRNFTSPNRKIW